MADRAYKHQHTCAACGFVASGATNVSGVGTPEVGDMSVCAQCGAILVFVTPTTTRVASQADIDGVPPHLVPALQDAAMRAPEFKR